MMHYHGTPITPRSVLYDLAGKNFCVSFADPRDIIVCHQIGQSVMLDNGAYTVWKQGGTMDWYDWQVWAERWTEHHNTWAVLPDVVDGNEEDNDALLAKYDLEFGVPVWHLHESLDRLATLVSKYQRVCFGSSGTYAVVGGDAWRRQVTRAFDRLSDEFGRVPWVHMLRGMSLSGQEFPFASVDSTDVARNHNREHNNARAMADRWDAIQCPAYWVTHRQMELTG